MNEERRLFTMSISFILLFLSMCFFISCGLEQKRKEAEKKHNAALQFKEELIEEFSIHSLLPHDWTFIGLNSEMYTDRDYVYLSVPSQIDRNLTLQTANEDKYFFGIDPIYIRLKLKKDATLYVIYSDISTDLESRWLNEQNGWKKEEFTVETSQWQYQSTRLVRSRFFPGGSEVNLGGNGCLSSYCGNYTVVFVPESPGIDQ